MIALLAARFEPSERSVITYVAPVIAVALGVVALGERPGAAARGGLVAILAGSWLATGGGIPRRLPGWRERSADPDPRTDSAGA
jgi:drug/metabolite transporter (DMT)-like permease